MTRSTTTNRNPIEGQYSPRKAVIYARVSSKEQDREGFSIPAQLKLLNEFAVANEFTVAKEFVDVETAKTDGRRHFGDLVAYLRRHPSVRTVLVEKTDRLYRNLKDWVTLDGIDIEIHLVKEGTCLSRDSRSSEKFMHGIKVLMAKNYIDNLSEEVRKGMLEKAQQGLWPSAAPFGYKNVVAPDGKRLIELDDENAHIIAQMFQWYATGNYNLREVGSKARAAGLIFRRSRQMVPLSSISRILRNRVYTGEFEWLGTVYKGSHQALISKDLWQLTQDLLDGRFQGKLPHTGGTVREFAFTGMIACGHCGCAMVAEIKKNKYIYYHCTLNKGRCPERKWVREEVLVEQFSALLLKLRFDWKVYDLVVRALKSSFAVEREEHAQSLNRIKGELERLNRRLETLYVDKLDRKISEEFYSRTASQWKEEVRRCEEDLIRHHEASEAYMDEGVSLLTLAQDAHFIFEKQPDVAQKKLLNFVFQNCIWLNGELSADFRQPFDMLQETASKSSKPGDPDGYDDAGKENWLGN